MNEVAKYEALPVEQLRDRVMDDLVRQYSLERVSLDEFERRTSLVAKAATRGELLAQVADLPELPPEKPAPERGRRPRGAARWRMDADGAQPGGLSLAIFGGSDYRGAWRAPRQLTSICVFGGSKVDLREAIVHPDGISISCVCLFGGLDVVVPSGMRVVVRGAGIFGGFDRTSNEPEDADAPTVVVDGVALFGGVSVKIRD